MLKKLIISIICLQFFTAVYAQDTIVQINGTEIKAKVREIDDVNIKYNRFDNLTGPVYSVKKSQVALIKYENGTRDVFTGNNLKTDIPKTEKPKSTEQIVIKKGRYYFQGKYMDNRSLKDFMAANASPDVIQTLNKGLSNTAVCDLLTYTGLVTEVTGLLIYYSSNRKSTAGAVLAIAGFGVMTVGLPFNYSGRALIKKSVLKYNNSVAGTYKPVFNFGLNPQGFVVSYRF
jgi:hypothetical protein